MGVKHLCQCFVLFVLFVLLDLTFSSGNSKQVGQIGFERLQRGLLLRGELVVWLKRLSKVSQRRWHDQAITTTTARALLLFHPLLS